MDSHKIYELDKSIGLFLTLLVLSGLAFYVLVVFWPQPNPRGTVKVVVEKGASLSEIAESLQIEGVIDDPLPFILATRMMGYDKSIKAGVFLLSDARTNYRIVHQLVSGSPVARRITIPEGLRMNDVAAICEEKLGIQADDFLRLCQDQYFINSLDLKTDVLEGFLFPETYYFREGEKPEEIIQKIVSQYKQFFRDSLRARAAKLNLTEFQVITLASIIEGEAIYDSERPLISAVYHNRLKRGMKLQADPTIQYIIDNGPRHLLNKDLKIDSPYNTYLYPGLPPGPINSPGKESILAALYPAHVDYLYFVANGDGYHTFSRTEREHLEAKRKFQKVRNNARRQNRTNSHQTKTRVQG